MSSVSLIFFIAFIIFSLISISFLLSVFVKIKSHQYYGNVLLGGLFSIVLLTLFSALFVTFPSQHFLLFAGLIASFTINVAYLIKGASQASIENVRREELVSSLQEEIRQLKEAPNLALQHEEAMLDLPMEWLEKMVALFAIPHSFEDELLPFMLTSLTKLFGADGAVFFLADAFEDSLVCKSYVGNFPPPYKLGSDVPHKEDMVKMNFKYYECNVGESLFGKVAENGKPYYISSYVEDGIVFQNGEEDFLKIGSIIAIPLFTNGYVSAVFALSKNAGRSGFTESDFQKISNLAKYFTSIVSLVIIKRDYYEMALLNNTENMAQEFRQLLLPKKLKNRHNLDIDCYFRKQSGVCSDYYDIIQHRDRIFVVVLDVAGKSMQAVVVMIMIRAILYLITNTNKNLDEIIDWLNKGITGKLGIDHFSTMSLICYHPKEKKLDVVAAGNQSMILYRAKTNDVEVFHHRTDPIGIDVNSKYKSLTYTLNSEDIILLYTDGISTMLNKDGKPFEVNLLAKLVVENNKKNANDIIKVAKNLIDEFVCGTSLHDDQTLLTIKVK